MNRTRALAALTVSGMLTLGVVGAACSSDDGGSATTTTTASSSGTLPKSFSVSTPKGEVSLSLDGQLPSSWPSAFPVPSGAEPAGSGALAGSESGVQVGVFRTSEAAKDVFSWYQGQSSLSPSGAKSTGLGQSFVGTMVLGGSYEGTIWIGGREDATYVVVVLTGSTGAGGTGTTTTTAGSTSTTSGPTTTSGGSVSS